MREYKQLSRETSVRPMPSLASVGRRITFRNILEYFDVVKIGLVATPALHTTEIRKIDTASPSCEKAPS